MSLSARFGHLNPESPIKTPVARGDSQNCTDWRKSVLFAAGDVQVKIYVDRWFYSPSVNPRAVSTNPAGR